MGKRMGKHEPFRLSTIPFRQSLGTTQTQLQKRRFGYYNRIPTFFWILILFQLSMTVIFYAYSRLFVVLLALKVITAIMHIINNGSMYSSVQRGIELYLLPDKLIKRLYSIQTLVQDTEAKDQRKQRGFPLESREELFSVLKFVQKLWNTKPEYLATQNFELVCL